jgi:Helix-turn-helix
MLLGKTDAAAAEMLSMSQSQVTRIKNGKASITQITAKSLVESIEGAWHRMMDETPATLGDDWAETSEGDSYRMTDETPATLGDDWAEPNEGD